MHEELIMNLIYIYKYIIKLIVHLSIRYSLCAVDQLF